MNESKSTMQINMNNQLERYMMLSLMKSRQSVIQFDEDQRKESLMRRGSVVIQDNSDFHVYYGMRSICKSVNALDEFECDEFVRGFKTDDLK